LIDRPTQGEAMAEFWTAVGTLIGALGTFIVAVFTAWTAWATGRSVKEMTRGAEIATARMLQHKMLEHVDKATPQCLELEDKIAELDKTIAELDKTIAENKKQNTPSEEQKKTREAATADKYRCTKLLFATWEYLSAGLNVNALDFEIFYN